MLFAMSYKAMPMEVALNLVNVILMLPQVYYSYKLVRLINRLESPRFQQHFALQVSPTPPNLPRLATLASCRWPPRPGSCVMPATG